MSETGPAKLRDLRELPSVDQLLKTEVAKRLQNLTGLARLTAIAREVTMNFATRSGYVSGQTIAMKTT